MSFFLPTVALKRVTDISEELLNSLGIRAVFLDVDNTLSTHGSQSPFEGSVAWAQNLVVGDQIFTDIIGSRIFQKICPPLLAQTSFSDFTSEKASPKLSETPFLLSIIPRSDFFQQRPALF